MAGPSAMDIFNCHIWENFTQILREAPHIELEWTMFSASIADVAALNCGVKVSGASCDGRP